MNNEYSFGKPIIMKDEWYVFKDSTLSNLNINDCNTSVTGICERTKNIEECLDICKKQQPCKSGYYIETGKENICVPLRESNVSSSAGPYYRLRNKDIYPILKNMKSYVFSNISDVFPPKHVNNLFYSDSIQIQILDTDKYIGLDQNALDIAQSEVVSDKIDVQIIPNEILAARLSRYIIVKHGDKIQINIPRTAYILQDNENSIIWKMRASLNSNERSFQIFSKDPSKKIGDYLNYDETFYLLYNNSLIEYNKDFNKLIISSESLQNLDMKGSNIYFKIIPKVKAYYCGKDNTVQNIILDKAVSKGETASYEGKVLSRNEANWNLCTKGENILKNNNIAAKIIIVLISLFFVFLIFKKFFSMKSKKIKK